MADENARSRRGPMPEIEGGHASFIEDVEYVGKGKPIGQLDPGVVVDGETPVDVDAENPDLVSALLDVSQNGVDDGVVGRAVQFWAPDPDSDGYLDRKNAVYQAVGAGSVCWEDMSGTGVFQDDKATAVAEGLLAWLDEDDRSRLPAGELEGFRRIHGTSQRLQDKIMAEPNEDWDFDRAQDFPGPWKRWRQLDDGTWASDRYGTGPGLTVVVERRTPADLPFIHLIGRTQEINPGAARWLALRLAEATAIVETAVIP